MHNRKNLFKILALLAVFSMLLTACVATPPPAAAPAAGAEATAAPAGEQAAAAPAEGEQITLRWANINDATSTEQWQPILDAFHAKYPNITVSSESTAGSGAAVYPDVLKTSML